MGWLKVCQYHCYEIDQLNELYECCIQDVQTSGAVGDGKTLDTVAIQTAVDNCGAKEDGGIVEFEAGKSYLSGSLTIPSKVTLKLPKKTVLLASTQVGLLRIHVFLAESDRLWLPSTLSIHTDW